MSMKFYGVTTKYVTKLLHWTIFYANMVEYKKMNKNEKPPLTSWSVYREIWSKWPQWCHAYECVCVCVFVTAMRPPLSYYSLLYSNDILYRNDIL